MSDTKKKPRPKVKKPYVKKGRKTKLMKMAKRVPKHWMDREDEKEREKNPKKKPKKKGIAGRIVAVQSSPDGPARKYVSQIYTIKGKFSAKLSTSKALAVVFSSSQSIEVMSQLEKNYSRELAKAGYTSIIDFPAGKK